MAVKQELRLHGILWIRGRFEAHNHLRKKTACGEISCSNTKPEGFEQLLFVHCFFYLSFVMLHASVMFLVLLRLLNSFCCCIAGKGSRKRSVSFRRHRYHMVCLSNETIHVVDLLCWLRLGSLNQVCATLSIKSVYKRALTNIEKRV